MFFTTSVVIKHKKINLRNPLSFFPSLSLCLNQCLTPSDSFALSVTAFCIFLSLFFLFLIQICIKDFFSVKKPQASRKQPTKPNSPNKICFAPAALLSNALSHFPLFSVCFVLCQRPEIRLFMNWA